MIDLKLDEIRAEGYTRGYNIASWVDMPNAGQKYRIDSIGTMFCEDADSMAEIMQAIAYESESNDRDFSPFEFTAHDLNEREDSDEAWEAYQEGIDAGIAANIGERISKVGANWFEVEV